MSLSNLGAQLVSLNNLKYSSSKHTNEDAVTGRGANFDAKQGHSLLLKNHEKSVPSILMTSRAAADIPMSTLRINFEKSVKELELMGVEEILASLSIGAFVNKEQQTERQLLTSDENAKVDGSIRGLLNQLSTHLLMNQKTKAKEYHNTHVLHILEYLLRAYQIHERRSIVTWFITCLLPCHEAPFFKNVLQLVDLADVAAASYQFLRPHMRPSSNNANVGIFLDRKVIVQQMVKDDALVGLICELARNAARVNRQEQQQYHKSNYKHITRPGVSYILSFAAVVIMEAFQEVRSLQEQTVRTVIPFVASACGNTSGSDKEDDLQDCLEYRHFGYILCAIMAQRCTLSSQLKEVLTASIVKGAIRLDKMLVSNDEGESLEALEISVDALLTVLNVLLKCRPDRKDEKDWRALKLHDLENNSEVSVGCVLPRKTHLLLSRHRLFAPALGNIVDTKSQDFDLRSFVAGVISSSILLLDCRKEGTRSGSDMLMKLAMQSSLKDTWSVLSTPSVKSVISSFVERQRESKQPAFVVENFKKAVIAIRKADSFGCDSVIAKTISENSSDRSFLQHASLILQSTTICLSSNNMPVILPARVALEHSDPSVRLDAISRLVAESKSRINNMNDNEDLFDDQGGENLLSAFIRRVTTDDISAVVCAAAHAYEDLSSMKSADFSLAIAPKEMVRCLCKWGIFTKKSSNSACTKTICALLSLTKFVERSQENLDFADLIITISSHLIADYPRTFLPKIDDISVSEISIASALSIVQVLGWPSDFDLKAVLSFLTQDTVFLFAIKKSAVLEPNNESLNNMRQRALFLSLISCKSLLSERKDEYLEAVTIATLSSVALLKNLNILGDNTNGLIAIKSELMFILSKISDGIIKHLVENESVLTKFCSVQSDGAFEEVCLPVIHTIIKRYQGEVIPWIMKNAYDSSKNAIISRLLKLASEIVISNDIRMQGLVYSLAMLGNSKKHLRKHTMDYFKRCSNSRKCKNKEEGIVLEVYHLLDASFRTDFEMDGQNTIPRFLIHLVKRVSNPQLFRSLLLKQCRFIAFGFSNEVSTPLKFGQWSPLSLLFEAIEISGEEYFPLAERWAIAGKDIFNSFCCGKSVDERMKIEECLRQDSSDRLMRNTIRMLRGVKSNSSSTLSVLSGPSSRGRSRSYSLGADEELYLSPYPNDMVNSLSLVLSSKNSVLKILNEVVKTLFSNPSWLHHVFSKLDEKYRRTIAESLLFLRINNNNEFIEDAILGLTLSIMDIQYILSTVIKSEHVYKSSSKKNLAIVVIADCIKIRLPHLPLDENIFILIDLFVQELSHLSNPNNEFNEDGRGVEYTRVAILEVLSSIFEAAKELEEGSVRSTRKQSKKPSFEDHKLLCFKCGQTVVDLLGTGYSLPLRSARGKEAAIALLSSVCSMSPDKTIPFVMIAISKVMNLISRKSDINDDADAYAKKTTKELLHALVPLFCAKAHLADLSYLDLIGAILRQANDLIKEYNIADFFLHFLSAFALTSQETVASSSFIAAFIANVAFITRTSVSSADGMEVDELVDENNTRNIGNLLMKSVTQNLTVSIRLVQITSKLIGSLSSGKVETSKMSSNQSIEQISLNIFYGDVAAIAVFGLDNTKSSSFDLNEKSRQSIMMLVTDFLALIRDNLASSSARQMIRSTSGTSATSSLQLWKDLMQFHTDAMESRSVRIQNEVSSVEDRFWDIVTRTIQESLDSVQRMLPTPHFLASVTSLLLESGHVGLQRRALRLLASRSSEIEPLPSAEAALFLDTIPELTVLLQPDYIIDNSCTKNDDGKVRDARRKLVLYQSILTTIDQVVGHLCSQTNEIQLSSEECSVLMPALDATIALMKTNANTIETDNADSSIHLVSTTALVAATLISKLKARSLPLMSQLFQSLLSALKYANESLLESSETESSATLRHMQKSVLRCFTTIVDTLPQFVGPYLRSMLSSDSCFSTSLRTGTSEDIPLFSLVEILDKSLSTKVPSRLLIPIACEIIPSSLQENKWLQAKAALGIMEQCICSSTRADLSSGVIKTIGGIMSAFSFSGDEGRIELLTAANATLLSLVMKLSEAQLRPLYSRLREWRGDIDDSSTSSIRRHAFWSMTAVLSRELKGIFLPCMSSVVTDLVKELELASTLLKPSSKKNKDGNKRRRVSKGEFNNDMINNLKPLEPVLLSIENTLKSDAHDGGDWIRADDSKRYQQILSPLSKLLLSDVPETLPLCSEIILTKKRSSYEILVKGNDSTDSGNVSGCIIALAAAAGSEQLWKPLNHAILTACGHESRSEVRRAGIHILLTIIRTLGEEYMVLLPDCLPVLSELLEDQEEDIASMAKECVRLGEELLGETLEL